MKRLIINADDFGLTEGINNGIADSDAFLHAVNIAQKNNIRGMGVHVLFSKDEKSPQRYYRFPWKYFTGRIGTSQTFFNIKNHCMLDFHFSIGNRVGSVACIHFD